VKSTLLPVAQKLVGSCERSLAPNKMNTGLAKPSRPNTVP